MMRTLALIALIALAGCDSDNGSHIAPATHAETITAIDNTVGIDAHNMAEVLPSDAPNSAREPAANHGGELAPAGWNCSSRESTLEQMGRFGYRLVWAETTRDGKERIERWSHIDLSSAPPGRPAYVDIVHSRSEDCTLIGGIDG